MGIDLWRIQESLINVDKYLQANNVWIELVKKNLSVDLLVRNDGVFFDTGMAITGKHRLISLQIFRWPT